VGSSTASALLRSNNGIDITLAGRSRSTYEAAIKKRPELADTQVCSSLATMDLPSQSKHALVEVLSSWSGTLPLENCLHL
jgi:saccharopine dehydrogenase-like NADP-dependent oxidoreductase